MSEVCQVQVQLLRKLQENSWRLSKEKSDKAQVKKSATLLNIYFFSRNFARSSANCVALYRVINTKLSKINFISSNFLLSIICSLIFLQSKGWKRQTLWIENIKSFVSCLAIIFSMKTPWERARNPRCFKKRSVGLQNLMFRKYYFQIQEKSLTFHMHQRKFDKIAVLYILTKLLEEHL